MMLCVPHAIMKGAPVYKTSFINYTNITTYHTIFKHFHIDSIEPWHHGDIMGEGMTVWHGCTLSRRLSEVLKSICS